ncbi:hypothetical protein [Collimonas silvisoli]|uniref:hypothetical protein n=1 Tax=Collimonas silvisoli TaxID=2825884 RepID=UPI001B8B73DB|nr:hypothetical protein [Collimonas silvisoli]
MPCWLKFCHFLQPERPRSAHVSVAQRVIIDPPSALQASNLKRNCRDFGIKLFNTDHEQQGQALWIFQ